MPDPEAVVSTPSVPDSTGGSDALQLDAGDQPLVPPDAGVESLAGSESSPASTGQAQAKQPETTQQKATAPKEPPAGYVSEADFRALQSRADRREAEMRRAAQELVNAQAAEAQAEGVRREVRQWLVSQGVDPDQQAGQVDNITKMYRRSLEGEQRLKEAEARAAELQAVAVNTVMASWINHLSTENKLDASDVETLRGLVNTDQLNNFDVMRRAGGLLSQRAKQLGQIRAAAAAAQRAKEAEVKPQGFESGRGSGTMTDQQIVEAFAEGRLNDFKQAEDAMKRLGTW